MNPGSGVAIMETFPGFRFSPTEYELVGFYLKTIAEEKDLGLELIATVDLYKHDPWELPGLAISLPFMGDSEWYFFVPRQHKYPNGSRPNRVTTSGYWKATGTDKPVMDKDSETCIGLRKTLVFYKGKAPRGEKTPWIMNEYRFHDEQSARLKKAFTLCKIYQKSGSRGCRRSDNNSPMCDSDASPPQLQMALPDETEENQTIPAIAMREEGSGILAGLRDSGQPQQQSQATQEQLDNVMFSGFEDIQHLNYDPDSASGYPFSEEFEWTDNLT